jgi:hypothetical protein
VKLKSAFRVFVIVGASACGDADAPGDPTGSSSTTGAGGTDVADLACESTSGCVRGDVALALHCTAPDDGSGVTTWDSVVSQHPKGTGEDGVCFFLAPNVLGLGFGGAGESNLQLAVLAFTGGGEYHLGASTSSSDQELSIHGEGYRGDPALQTYTNVSQQCSSQGCELDVLPHGRPVPIAGEWATYRFVVTCAYGIGNVNNECGTCLMEPESFTMDAACYMPPASP